LNFNKLILILFGIAILLVACSEKEPETKYLQDLAKYRADVKEFFKNSEDSPVVDMTEKIIPFYYKPNED